MKNVYIWARQSTDAQSSKEAQYAQGIAYIEQHGYRLAGSSVFTGSTWEDDPELFFVSMRADGVTAYDDLKSALYSGGVDILWVEEPTRLGRAPWLPVTIGNWAAVNQTTIVFDHGGMDITSDNVGMSAAIISMGSRATIEQLHSDKAWQTDKKKAAAGLPVQGKVPWTHRLIKNADGHPLRVVVNADKRVIVQDATTMFLDGMSFGKIAVSLSQRYREFQTMDAAGVYQPMIVPTTKVTRMFYHYLSHGNTAISERGYGRNVRKVGVWCFDPDALDRPEGVLLFPDTCERLWQGAEYARLKSLLRHVRNQTVGAYNRTTTRNPFAGILVCAECGYNIVYSGHQRQPDGTYRYAYLGCQSHKPPRLSGCSNKTLTPFNDVVAFFDAHLRAAIDTGMFTVDFAPDMMGEWQSKLDRLYEQMEKAITTRDFYIGKQGDNIETASEYQPFINEQRDMIKEIEQAIQRVRLDRPYDVETSRRALQSIDVDRLWDLPPGQINQVLIEAMGGLTLRMYGDEFIF